MFKKHHTRVNILKKSFTLLYSQIKNLVFRAGIHKMLIRIVNREDLDQTAFSWFSKF